MSNEVDYYDVQSMIRDACVQMRGEIRDAVAQVRDEARSDLLDQVLSIDASLDSLRRVLDSRTEHLA